MKLSLICTKNNKITCIVWLRHFETSFSGIIQLIEYLAQKNYYDVLGVSNSATTKEIKEAYLKFAKKYHPDTNKSDKDAKTKFQEISEAYKCLSDESKRKKYDTSPYTRYNFKSKQKYGKEDFWNDLDFDHHETNWWSKSKHSMVRRLWLKLKILLMIPLHDERAYIRDYTLSEILV